jgi:hypothetical protein
MAPPAVAPKTLLAHWLSPAKKDGSPAKIHFSRQKADDDSPSHFHVEYCS